MFGLRMLAVKNSTVRLVEAGVAANNARHSVSTDCQIGRRGSHDQLRASLRIPTNSSARERQTLLVRFRVGDQPFLHRLAAVGIKLGVGDTGLLASAAAMASKRSLA